MCVRAERCSPTVIVFWGTRQQGVGTAVFKSNLMLSWFLNQLLYFQYPKSIGNKYTAHPGKYICVRNIKYFPFSKQKLIYFVLLTSLFSILSLRCNCQSWKSILFVGATKTSHWQGEVLSHTNTRDNWIAISINLVTEKLIFQLFLNTLLESQHDGIKSAHSVAMMHAVSPDLVILYSAEIYIYNWATSRVFSD